jgi:ubiquinone/menaquinone biosynthesis C-methylase UbiE
VNRLTAVDTHVHLYDCYPVAAFLDVARDNFAAAARVGPDAVDGVLMLADPAGADSLERLRRFQDRPAGERRGWHIEETGEPISLRARRDDGAALLLVAGRQVITAEKLELLALGTVAPIADGEPLPDTIERAQTTGALPVVAWGVGKWLGRRGRLLQSQLNADPDSFHLGDNGGRPWFWPRPAIMRAPHPRPLLAGSDPFPFLHDLERVGRHGLLLDGPLSPTQPAQELITRLARGDGMRHFGRQIGVVAFLNNFWMMRRRRHARDGSTGERETPDIVTASDDYARRFAGDAGAYLLEVQSRAVRSALKAPFGDSVLELGGGHAQLAPLLRERSSLLVELGSDSVCHARLRRHHGTAIDCVTGDLLRLPFADRSIDLVIAVRLLPHVENWPQLVAECCRVARQAVVLDYPSLANVNFLSPLLFQIKKRIEGNTRHYLSFYQYQLARELRRHGFAVSRRVPQFFLPMVIHRLTHGHPWLRTLERVFARLGLTWLLGSPVILRADRVE